MLSKYQCQKQNHVFCHISYKKIKLFEILKNRRCILAKAYKYYLLFWGFQVLLLIILLLISWNLFQNSWKQKPFTSFRLTCKLQICQDINVKLMNENFHKIVCRLTILRFEVFTVFLIRILLFNDGDKVFYNWGLNNSLVKRIRCCVKTVILRLWQFSASVAEPILHFSSLSFFAVKLGRSTKMDFFL